MRIIPEFVEIINLNTLFNYLYSSCNNMNLNRLDR